MLHALSLGAPPHGGIAPGIDRIVMLLCGEENLREVVLFPMNQRAEDLLMGAPVGGHAEAVARTAYPAQFARKELTGAAVLYRSSASDLKHAAQPTSLRMPFALAAVMPQLLGAKRRR